MGRLRPPASAIGVIMLITAGLIIAGCIFPLKDLLLAQSEAISGIIADQVIYVAQAYTGDELGSKPAPFRSIQPAMDLATELISQGSTDTIEVQVAAGTYKPDATIRLTPGTSLRGGFSYPDWSSDPAAAKTIIYGLYDPVIDFDPECGRATVFQDIVIEAAPLEELCAVKCDGAGPIIRGNTIHMPAVWNTSIGLMLVSDHSLVDSNQVYIGAVKDNSWAIAAIASEAEIHNNILTAEEGEGTSILIHATQDSTLEVCNNTMYLRAAGDTIVFISSSSLRFDNNILGAETDCRGIYENTVGSPSFTTLRNNAFYRTTDPLFRASDGGEITSIAAMESYVISYNTEASENDSGTDPGFVSPGEEDFHITANPLPGLDLSDQFQHDADGITRTTPWSVGAYELD